MGTRSRIAIEKNDGTVTSIYCHWDGYPDHNGRILVENYTDRAKVEELIALGDLSSLNEKVKPEVGDHSYDSPQKGVTIAYHRDRDEEFSQMNHKNANEYLHGDVEEYGYLFTKDNEWIVKDGSEIQLVNDVL
jgi:hypothetical protein